MSVKPTYPAILTERSVLDEQTALVSLRSPTNGLRVSAGETINVCLSDGGETRRVSSFSVFTTDGCGVVSILVRRNGEHGVSNALVTESGKTSSFYISDSFRTSKLKDIQSGSSTFAILAGSGITALGGLLDNGSLSHVSAFFVGKDSDCTKLPAFVLDRLVNTKDSQDYCSVRTWNSTLSGRPCAEVFRLLASYEATARRVVVCGPGPFCEMARAGAVQAGWAAEDVVVEAFGSYPAEVETPDGVSSTFPAKVRIGDDVHSLQWNREQNLVDVLRELDINVPYSCRAGICSTCQCFVHEGEAEMDLDLGLSDAERNSGLHLACQLKPRCGPLSIEFP